MRVGKERKRKMHRNMEYMERSIHAHVLSTSVRTTLRMRAIYKNQFLPWQHKESKAGRVGKKAKHGSEKKNRKIVNLIQKQRQH